MEIEGKWNLPDIEEHMKTNGNNLGALLLLAGHKIVQTQVGLVSALNLLELAIDKDTPEEQKAILHEEIEIFLRKYRIVTKHPLADTATTIKG
jgi:hypothetical protein